MYEINCAILRTVPPVMLRRPWGRVDAQALPPYAWCSRCGREVYRAGMELCGECGHYG